MDNNEQSLEECLNRLKLDSQIEKANIEDAYKETKRSNKVARKTLKLKKKADRKAYRQKLKDSSRRYASLVEEAQVAAKNGQQLPNSQISKVQPLIEDDQVAGMGLFQKPSETLKDYTTYLNRDQLLDLEKKNALPAYSHGEEVFSSVTHIVGAGLGVVELALGVACSIIYQPAKPSYAWAMGIFGLCIILLYTMSAIYHGLNVNKAKRVFQILDHCTVYVLVAGTYVPVCLICLNSLQPWNYLYLGLVILCDGIGVTLTATMMKKKAWVQILAQILYIGTGWSVIFFYPTLLPAITIAGVWLIIAGGISYTIGAVFFAIGITKPYFHSIFHLFVLAGTLLQYLGILLYGVIGL